MAENLGSIRYDFDVTTAPLFKASDTVNKTTDSIVSDFKRVDSSSKSLNTQVTKTADGVKKSVHRNFGQAGIQVQQFVGQLQGGQSAMLALSQQSADLGIVLGAPMVGVIVSLGAVLLGTLLPSLMSNKTSADALAKSVENVKAVMTLGAGGVAEYTEEMEKLNRVSKQLAKIQLAQAIVEQNKVIKLSAKSVIESAQNTSKLYESTFSNMRSLAEKVAVDIGGSMEDVAKAVSGDSLKLGSSGSYLTADLDKMSSKFKITREEALELGLAFSDVSKKGDAMSLKSLQNVLEDLSETYGYSNEKITKLAAGVVEFLVSANSATDGINELRGALSGTGDGVDELTGKTKTARDTFESLSEQLEIEKVRLEEGERAAFQKALKMQDLTDAQIENLTVLWDDNEALKKNNEARKEASDELDREIDGYIKLADAVVKSENAKKERETKALTTQVQSIGLTPLEEIQARYEAEKAALEQAEADKIEIVGTYAERYKQIEAEKQEAIKGLQGETNQFLSDAFGNLDTQMAGTLASVVTGARDGKDALKSLADTILTQVIGAVVKWGVAEVAKLFTVETAEKGIEAANAAATTASVSAQVGMTSALAAQNAFMATAAIPVVGPSLAPAAAAAAATASGTLGAPAIPLAPLAGAREFGGPVSAGSMYRVGEKGKPEFYKDNLGKLSMIPGENGEVIPADKMGGGMSVIINNNAAGVDVSANQVDSRTVEISVTKAMQEFANQVRTGQGDAIRSLTSSTNLIRRG